MIRILLVVGILFAAPLLHAETFSFAILGDSPYNERERAQMPGMLQTIAESGAAFAVHVGDIKGNGEPCSDELFAERFALFDSSPIPFVLVPGDNDWLDCSRHTAGGYPAEERLDALRKLFFARPAAIGAGTLAVERQSEADFNHGAYVEHLAWQKGPLLFVTANVPGGDNNWGSKREASAEYRARMSAVRDWLEQAFLRASKQKLRALVIFMQADPDFEAYAEGKPVAAFAEVLDGLRAGLKVFDGEVLLAHGDTHVLRIDRPFRDDENNPVERFRRIETYGSPLMGWVRVEVDTEATRLLRIRPQPLNEESSETQ